MVSLIVHCVVEVHRHFQGADRPMQYKYVIIIPPFSVPTCN